MSNGQKTTGELGSASAATTGNWDSGNSHITISGLTGVLMLVVAGHSGTAFLNNQDHRSARKESRQKPCSDA